MLRQSLILWILFISLGAYGERAPLRCHSLTSEETPEVEIHFLQGEPYALYIREPGQKKFEPLNIIIRQLNSKNHQGIETFNAVPLGGGDPMSGEESPCYKKIGTRYEFQFFHRQKLFHMQRAPQYSVSRAACPLPHFNPTYDQMSCEPAKTPLK